jgi:hypothetical protein
LDHLSDIAAIKHAICSDPRTVYAFISPSAGGLKLGVHVDLVPDDASYKHAWHIVSAEYEGLYGGRWDPSGKDVARLCYASWDPEVYWNPAASLFEVPPPPVQESPAPTSVPRSFPPHMADRCDAYAVRAIRTAVQMIQTAMPGARHHARLRASRLLGGYIISGLMSYDQAYTVLAQALDGHTEDMKKALKTVKNGLEYGMADPISCEALEADRQAWLEQHVTRPRRLPVHGDPPESAEALVSDHWEGMPTLPLRPYSGYRGLRYGRA